MTEKRKSRTLSPPPTGSTPTPTPPPASAEQSAVILRLRQTQNPWKQLGIEKGSSKEEVNKTYRKLALLLHPDKTAVQGADEAFKLLGIARRLIINTL